MPTIRRWYFYLVCAISLQAVTWAVIALLRNLLIPAFGLTIGGRSVPSDLVALQIAVIIVGLPLFFVHWRWATRSETELDEPDHLRALYLYVMLTAFLLPLVFNTAGLVAAALRQLFGVPAPFGISWQSNDAALVSAAAAMLVLALFAAVHARLLQEQRPFAPPAALPDTYHRLFLYLFSALGLAFVALGATNLLALLLRPPDSGIGSPSGTQIAAVAQLLTGLVVWLLSWRAAQRLFRGGARAEQDSLLRKGYLYVVIFLTLIVTVSDAALLLAGLLRGWFGLPNRAGAGTVLASLLVAAPLGIYHALVLREDAAAAPEAKEQAAIRRLFWYLVAAVGLLATLIGLGGVISVGANAATLPGQTLAGDVLRERLAWFLAVLIAGLPLWLVAWRQIQAGVAAEGAAGLAARRDPARRFYLYGFILLATLTFLGTAVFIVFLLLNALLGEALDERDVGQLFTAAAYALLAVLVWLYHSRLLRQDNEAIAAARPESATQPRIVVLDDGDGRFARLLQTSLVEALPAATIATVPLGNQALAALGPAPEGQPPTAVLLQQAHVIVAPWTATTPYAGPPLREAELGVAFAAGPAQRLIVPFALPGWNWSGVAPVGMETAVAQTVQAVQQIINGEPVRPRAPLGIGRVLLLLFALFLLITLLIGFLGSAMPFAAID